MKNYPACKKLRPQEMFICHRLIFTWNNRSHFMLYATLKQMSAKVKHQNQTILMRTAIAFSLNNLSFILCWNCACQSDTWCRLVLIFTCRRSVEATFCGAFPVFKSDYEICHYFKLNFLSQDNWSSTMLKSLSQDNWSSTMLKSWRVRFTASGSGRLFAEDYHITWQKLFGR